LAIVLTVIELPATSMFEDRLSVLVTASSVMLSDICCCQLHNIRMYAHLIAHRIMTAGLGFADHDGADINVLLNHFALNVILRTLNPSVQQRELCLQRCEALSRW
jgi:hypothetical protein